LKLGTLDPWNVPTLVVADKNPMLAEIGGGLVEEVSTSGRGVY